MQFLYQKTLWDIENFLEKETNKLKKNTTKTSLKNCIRKSFYLEENKGNNSFGFEKNKNKKLYVPEVIYGDEQDIKIGSEIVFEDEGVRSIGLESYVYGKTQHTQTPVFICDNHNQVLEAWNCVKDKQLTLVHIDQHKDDALFTGDKENWIRETKICDYISCAQQLNWIQEKYFSFIEIQDLDQIKNINTQEKVILNIDLDFFSPDLSTVNLEEKLKLILFFVPQVEIITLATSPLFIDQEFAIEIGKLFWKYL